MKYKLGLTLAMASVAGFAFVGPGQAGNDFKNKYDEPGLGGVCNDFGDRLEYFGPLKMWPPNHKLQDVLISATNVATGGLVSLTVVPTQAESMVGGDGGPRHDPDMVYDPDGLEPAGPGSVEVPMQLRSERSGRGDGRTYTMQADATFDGVRSCSLTIEVLVPHDMRSDHWKDQ